MNRKKFMDYLLIGGIIFIIVAVVWAVLLVKGAAGKCLLNPVEYFEDVNDGATCFCQKDGLFYEGVGAEGYEGYEVNFDELQGGKN